MAIDGHFQILEFIIMIHLFMIIIINIIIITIITNVHLHLGQNYFNLNISHPFRSVTQTASTTLF